MRGSLNIMGVGDKNFVAEYPDIELVYSKGEGRIYPGELDITERGSPLATLTADPDEIEVTERALWIHGVINYTDNFGYRQSDIGAWIFVERGHQEGRLAASAEAAGIDLSKVRGDFP
jgi:hypothetical protein